MSIVNDNLKRIAASKIRSNPLLRQQILNSINDKKPTCSDKTEDKGYFNSKRWKEKCFNIRYNTRFPDEFDE